MCETQQKTEFAERRRYDSWAQGVTSEWRSLCLVLWSWTVEPGLGAYFQAHYSERPQDMWPGMDPGLHSGRSCDSQTSLFSHRHISYENTQYSSRFAEWTRTGSGKAGARLEFPDD